MILQGLGVSPGVASGAPISVQEYQARSPEFFEHNRVVLLAPDLAFDVVANAILDGKVVAVVTEQGGLCSHGATLARECGIPCVVKIEETQAVLNGQEVIVDGLRGTVEVRGVAYQSC